MNLNKNLKSAFALTVALGVSGAAGSAFAQSTPDKDKFDPNDLRMLVSQTCLTDNHKLMVGMVAAPSYTDLKREYGANNDSVKAEFFKKASGIFDEVLDDALERYASSDIKASNQWQRGLPSAIHKAFKRIEDETGITMAVHPQANRPVFKAPTPGCR